MTTADQIQALEKKLEQVTHELGNPAGRARDSQAPGTRMGYLHRQVPVQRDAWTCSPRTAKSVSWAGCYKGKAGVRRLYIGRFQTNFTGGKNGPVHGFLLDHPQLQDIIDVAPGS